LSEHFPAVNVRESQVQYDDIGGELLNGANDLAAPFDHPDNDLLQLEKAAQSGPLVFCAATAAAVLRPSCACGRKMWNAVPPPGAWSAKMKPPCWVRTCRATANPSPVPERLVVKSGSKICSSISGAMPLPVSRTVRWTNRSCSDRPWKRLSSWVEVASVRVTAPPPGMASRALITRLVITCCI